MVGGLFVWLLNLGGLPIVPSAESFQGMKWWTLPTYVGIWSLVHFVRAARWSYLLAPVRRVPLRQVLSASFIGFAAVILLPFRTGEVVRPVLIHRSGALSGWTAAGTVGAERVIDGLFLSVMLFCGLTLSTPIDPLPNHVGDLEISVAWVPRGAYFALCVFFAAFVMMALFYWRRDFARRVVRAVVGIVSKKAADWISERVEKIVAGLGFLPRLRYTGPFLVGTTLYWMGTGAGLWLLAWGAGFETMAFSQACVVVGVTGLGILVPNAPGFMGAYQMGVYAGLLLYFPTEQVSGPGAGFVFLLYWTQLGIIVAAAALMMVLERTTVRESLFVDESGIA